MRVDRLDEVRATRAATGRLYEEFLRTGSMSAGVYELPAGSDDPQAPHVVDELYYVISGRATFTCGPDVRHVAAGDAIFVEAGAPHRFVDIAEDLSLLVVFAPPTPG